MNKVISKNSSGLVKLYLDCNCLNKPDSERKSGIPAEVLIPAPTINITFSNLFSFSNDINFLYFISFISSFVNNPNSEFKRIFSYKY